MTNIVINWLDKIPLEAAAKLALIAFAIAVAGELVLRGTLWIIRIRRAVRADGDIFIIK